MSPRHAASRPVRRVLALALAGALIAAIGVFAVPAASPGSAVAAAAAVPTGRLNKLVLEAKRQVTLGIPYLSAGGHGARPAALRSRVDCSGFVREMYGYAFGTDIGGGSGDGMVRLSGLFVRTSRPVPGDVALFGRGGRAPAYHSNIYIGVVNGHPAAVGSPTTGQNIKIQQWYRGSMANDFMGYWHYKNATARDSGPVTAPVVATRHALGGVNLMKGGRLSARLTGWSFDPLAPQQSNRTSIVVDGKLLANWPAKLYREDVARLIHIGPHHGFDLNIRLTPGRHTITLTSLPISAHTVSARLYTAVVTATG